MNKFIINLTLQQNKGIKECVICQMNTWSETDKILFVSSKIGCEDVIAIKNVSGFH